MKKALFVMLLCSSVTLTAQEPATRSIGNFSEIKVFDGISAELIKSQENKVEISGKDASHVEVVQSGGKLKIRMGIRLMFSGHTTFVKVYYTDPIDIIDANENALIASTEPLKQVDLDLKAQEGGEIKLATEVQRLKVKAVTGGKIEVRGSAKQQDIHINTGGQYEAGMLETEQTTVDVNAGGKASVNASEYVEAKVRAGGIIKIYGNPKVIEKETFLGGRIIER